MGELGTPGRGATPSRAALDGRWLLTARTAWGVAVLLVVGLSLVGLPALFSEYRAVCDARAACKPYWRLAPGDALALRELGLSAGFYATYRLAVDLAYVLGFWLVAAVVFRRRSDNPLALFFSFMLVAFGALNVVGVSDGVGPVRDALGRFVGFCAWTSFLAAFYVFPDGRFVPRWTRWALLAGGLYAAALLLAPAYSPLNPASWPPPLVFVLALGLLGTAPFAQVYRYSRASGSVERQQTKWVVFGLVVALAGAMAVQIPPLIYPALERSGVRGVVYLLTEVTAVNLFLLLIPLSLGVAILRYRLWDIDVVINRTLVYGTLTACVVGIYALVVGGLGTLLHAPGNLLISLVGAGLVAVLFAPLRERLQRGANRLMYGERDDPYAVLSRLGHRLGATFEPGAALSAIVETVAGALKLPYAAIAIKRGEDFEVAAARGVPTGEETALPLSYGGEVVGRLLLAPRTPGEAFSPADRRLLDDLARNAEVAVYAVRLTADLRGSRERLVSAREEERRRLRRDLHDGLGPTLASLTLGLDVSLKLLRKEPREAELMLSRLKEQTKDAVVDIRRLVYGLRPPALDDLGLVAAIREQAATHGRLRDAADGRAGIGLSFGVEAPESLPPLPAAVEVACYRIAQEAITNVARHARATACDVRISVDGQKNELVLEVSDDGVGLPGPGAEPEAETRHAGVGLSSMRERTDELGGVLSLAGSPEGGTLVSVRLPLPAAEDADG